MPAASQPLKTTTTTFRLAPLGAAVGLLAMIISSCGVNGSRGFVIAHIGLYTNHIICVHACIISIYSASQGGAEAVACVLLFHVVSVTA